MYLVLSAFTSSPISLVAPTKVSAFSLTVCICNHTRIQNRGQHIQFSVWATGWIVWGSNSGRHKRFFSSPERPDPLCGLPSHLFSGHRRSFPGGNVTEAWSWPFTFMQCRGREWVELYLIVGQENLYRFYINTFLLCQFCHSLVKHCNTRENLWCGTVCTITLPACDYYA